MPISREQKELIVADLADKFSRSQVTVLTDYRGLSTSELTRLRNQLREIGAGFHVVKNTLVRLALQKAGLPPAEPFLEGPTAIGFCYQDVSASVKAIVDFARDSKVMTIKGGILGDRILEAGEVSELSYLPSRDVLIAQVMAGLSAPLVGLVNALNGPLRGLVYVLQARTQQLESAGG